ncbi:hypothetical protein H8E07_21060 [bacterium]|nr:hypothetical protein [bacterium]
MKKIVNTTALSAAFAAVCFALIRDYGILATLKRAAIAYFAFYALGAVLVMVFRAGIQDDWIREDWGRQRAMMDADLQRRKDEDAARVEEKKRRKAERQKQLVGKEN